MDGRFVREDITKNNVMNPNLRAEKELLQLRANKFNSKTEAHRMELMKNFEFDKNSKLKIEFSPNITESFYSENYTNQINISQDRINNLSNLLKDQNEEIRKFAIRNLRDLSEATKKTINTFFDLNLLSTLINYLQTTQCKKEIFELTTVIINATFENKKFSTFILSEHISLIAFMDSFLQNFANFETLDFHIAFNHITIITNLLADNNSKNSGFEQKIFENFNIAVLFALFKVLPSLPNFIRIQVIWLFTNCLKVKKSEDANNQFLISYWDELEKFLSSESNLEILIKFFNFASISKMTTEILNFLLTLYDLESEKILTFLEKKLNFENKILDILRCFQEPRTLILAFKLMTKMADKEFFSLSFYNVFYVLDKIPFVLEYIEKDLLKYAPTLTSANSSTQIEPNNLNENPQQPSKPAAFNAEIIKLLDVIVFFLALFLEKKSSFASRIFNCQEMFFTLNSIFMLLTRGGVSKQTSSAVENYLFILTLILDLDNNTVYFFEFVRCNVLDFLIDLLRKGLEHKGIIVLMLKSFESMLSLADGLVEGSKNFVELQLEKLGLDSIIDHFRSDNDDEIATVANSIFEIYFQN